jgi:hypothetical protein
MSAEERRFQRRVNLPCLITRAWKARSFTVADALGKFQTIQLCRNDLSRPFSFEVNYLIFSATDLACVNR